VMPTPPTIRKITVVTASKPLTQNAAVHQVNILRRIIHRALLLSTLWQMFTFADELTIVRATRPGHFLSYLDGDEIT